MGMLAVAASILIFAALTTGAMGNLPSVATPIRPPVISCDNADYVFVLNLQQKDHSDDPAGFQQRLSDFIARVRLMTASGIGVGIVAFSKRVEHLVPVTRSLELVNHPLQRLLTQPPKFDGIATGDALLAALKLLKVYKLRLAEVGIKNRKLLVVAAVSGDKNQGLQRTFASSVLLRKVAAHVFAVNLAGGASLKELHRISSDGTRGIFEASTIVDAASKTEQYAQVFCPCPLPWTNYDNCTIRGQVQVQRFFYERSQDLPNNCIRNSTVTFEPCDCPANRVERSACVAGVIRVSTFVYSRTDNTTDCTESVSSTTEPCGRATGCESFVCPPGSQCVTDANGTISCNCTNPNDVFKVTGCESCGDRAPISSQGPCINGQRAAMVMTFSKINDTYCMIVTNRSVESCPGCPMNNTRQYGPCVRGYQQLTVVYYELKNDRCYRNLRTLQVKCRLSSEYQCIGTVMSGGQFVTFDGQYVDFPGPCNYLLTDRANDFQVRVQQAIKFPSLPYLTHVQSISVIIGNTSYELTHELVLKVSGVLQPLPYADAANSVEVIYSDDAVVFAKGELYIQMRDAAATVSVRTNAVTLRGILGNCNGNQTDDYTDNSGRDVSQQTDRDTVLGNSFLLTACVTTPCCPVPAPATCDTNTSLTAVSVANCGHLAADLASSPFAHCGVSAMQPMLRSCVALFCRAQDNPAWQSSLVCSTFEAAAFRCFLQQTSYNRSSYPVFRSPSFCSKTCGHNAEFVDDAEFCPKTCARHFFSSQALGCVTPFGYASRNANGQTQVPGCQCKAGFVLDGSNCVPPNQCECLSDLCIDRENRTVCEAWKAQGYCSMYPLQMRRYCKLTCEQCRVPCQDQINRATCQMVKAEGRCSDSFYRQMCQLTCTPSDCECPPCKTVRGPCDLQLQNRLVSRYCFAPDSSGHCQRNLTSTAYEPCGVCQTERRSVDTRACDYCAQQQVTRSTMSVREATGEMRCVTVASNSTTRSAGCECLASSNRTVCYRGAEVFLVSTVSAPSADCASCQTSVTETRVRNVTCPKTVQIGQCDNLVTKRRRVTVSRGVVRNCECDYITEEYEEMCACPKPHWTPLTCHRNRVMLRWYLAFSLVHGQCVPIVKPHKQRVPCHKQKSTKYHCKGCVRFRQRVWYERRNCRCVRLHKESRIGRCCCPKPTTKRGHCVGEQRHVTVTRYALENHECHAVVRVISERCGCPPSKPIKECDSETGVVTLGKLLFRLVDGTCEEVRQVKSVPIKCKEMRITRKGHCRLLRPDDTVKHRRVHYELWERIDGTCKCRHIRRVKAVACGCREPQVQLSKCPSNCPATSVSCPDHCHRTRAVIEYRLEDGRCVPEERDQEDLPCCCKKPLDKPPVCENSRVLARRKFRVELVGNACSLKEYVVRTDATRHCNLKDIRRERHGDLVIVKQRVVRNCRCVWLARRTRCPVKCPRPSRIVRCDGATGEHVVIERQHRLHACRCSPTKRVRRMPVACPEPKIERENLCSSERPAIVVKQINFYVDNTCRCRKKTKDKRYHCEQDGCDQQPTIRLICEGGQLYNVVTYFKKDEDGRCAQGERRHEVETPRCRGHGKKQFKKCIKGKTVVFQRWLNTRNCRCETKLRKRVLGPCSGYCEHRNHGKASRVKRQCDRETNQLVTYRLVWHRDEEHCVRKWVETQKHAEPDCPSPRTRRFPCDHETGKQRLERHEFKMHNCRCHGPKVKITYRKCSCQGPKVLGRYCDARQGRIVIRMLIHKWVFELDSCHKKLVRKFIPIPCRHHDNVKHGPCQHGHMKFLHIRYVRDRQNCRCHKKVKSHMVNCHCPVVIRRGKCTHDHHMAVTTMLYRKFDISKRRCVVVHQKRHHRRCRCPKRRVKKSCHGGKWLVSAVNYRLVSGECETDRSEERIGVVCRKPPVVRITECNRDTCHKQYLTYTWQVNHKNCRCLLRRVKKQLCRCCGCPKNQLQRRCISNNTWRLTTVIHSLRLRTCSRTCRRHEKHRTERVRCPERRRVHWSRCHRCQSRMVITRHHTVKCRCRRQVKMTGKFRTCCCKAATKLRTWCQQSTGLWINQIKQQVLHGYRCVWHSKIKYLPKSVCQLPETPVVYGVCDRSTCLQNVTKIVNVLNKHTCRCHFVNVPASPRTCCCNTSPQITLACINDNTIQRTTVALVFNETTNTCVSVTSIDTQIVNCGTGETRSSDPPCTGETRTIVNQRTVAVNCQCVNQTISTRSEMCVCPPGTNSTRCDGSSGQLEQTLYAYTLVNGSCPVVTTVQKIPVNCDTTPRSVPVCNNDTCIETVTTMVQQLDTATCSCVPRTTVTTQMCCCPTSVQTRSACISNQMETTNTRQVLDVTTRTCKPSETTTRAGDVPCANETRVDLGCDLATRNRTIMVTTRAVINCVCQSAGTSLVRQLCACPPERTYIGKCNKATCLRRIVVVQFNPVTSTNGSLECVKTRSYKDKRCCCTLLGHKRIQVRSKCDHETGNILVSKHWQNFIVTTGQCRDFHRSWIKTIECSGKFDGEDKLVQRGRCNHKNGLRKITVKWYTLDTRKCRCKLHLRQSHKVCSCRHKRGIKRNFCDSETNELVHIRRFFVLQDGTCAPQEENKREQVTCPENKKVRETCHDCNNVKIVSYNVLSHCKCKRKQIITRSKCCCPETKFHRTCHRGKARLTTIRFRLSVDKKSCERLENRRYKRIKCQQKHELRNGKCNRRTCFAQLHVVQFHLRHCKCQRRVRVHKRRCCCPKPRLSTRCHSRDTLVHESIAFHLRHERCVPEVSRRKNRIRCPEPRQIGKTRCSRETGKRHVKFRAFAVHECRCVPKLVHRSELCACPKPRIVRQPCKRRQRTRRVFRIKYRRHTEKCRPQKILLYKEPCHCPKPRRKKMCDPISGRTLVIKTLEFHLTSRHGRRVCVHSERNQPERIKCRKRKVRRIPCRHGHRKILTTEYHVRHCRCVRKRHMRRIRCRKIVKRRYKKRFCHKGRLIHVTIVEDPETGEKQEQRQVKKVICRDRPRTVPLSKGCQRRGEDEGLYRKFAIIQSFLHDCHCKQRRRITWRLCRCKGVKKSHRCVHEIIEQSYKEEHQRHHGHCRQKRVRRTREHRCPKRPVSLKKSHCDKRSCIRKVTMRRCWMKHCRCVCRKRLGHEICCNRPPEKKRFCKSHHMNFISTHFQMNLHRVIAKDSETGEEWKQIETKPVTRRWSKRIRCPKLEVRQSCNSDTGILTKRITVYRDIQCKCQPRMRTVHTRCRCPPPHTRAGHCVNGRRRLIHTSYHVGEDERCHKRHANSWKPCGCPKPKRSIHCSRGHVRICTVTFNRNHGCHPQRHCHSKTVHCPPPKKRRGRCTRSTNKAKLVFVRFTVNQKTCKCDRNVAIRHVYCSCSHLNRKHRKCHGNLWVTVKLNYHLQRGECLPDESVTHKALECGKQRTEIVPHTCERRSGLSSSGTQIARTLTSVPVNCHCKNRVRIYRVPCICSLIPKYKSRRSTVCSSNDRLVTTETSFHLKHGKCKLRLQKKKKIIRCHGTRTRRTTCMKDDLGDSFQYLLTFRKKPLLCHCRWVIVRKVRVNCDCRPPTSQTSCVGNDILETAVVRYSRPLVTRANCEPRTAITTKRVNCSEPRTIIQPCNTDTCYTKEVTISYKPKHCECHAIHSYRHVRCCCPPSIVSPEQCNPTTNQFEQVTSRYDLVNSTCVLMQNTTYRSVSCDTRSGETNTSVCNSATNRQTVSVRDVAILNCQCLSTVRSSSVPCSCANTQRIEQGLCNGTQNFTVDNYYRQVFNSTTGTCVEQLYNSIQRPCLCSAVTSNIICVRGNILHRETYVEQLVNNTCVNVTYVTEMEVTCAGNGTSQQTRSDCDPTTNTRSVAQTNYIVSNCTCAAQSVRSGEPCNCFQRNGGRMETSMCRADNVTVRTVSYFYDGPGGICLQTNVTTVQRVTCNGIKEDRQDCNEDSGKVEIRVFRLVPRTCQCVWSEQPTRYEDCTCKPSHIKRLCQKDKHLFLTTYYELIDGQCQKRQHKKISPVVCDKGGKMAGEHYGKCSSFSGTRQVVKYVHRLHHCRCVTKRIRKRCPCHCPNSRTWRACKDNRIVAFQLSYNLVGCRCVKRLEVQESQTFCAKRRVERSDCVRGQDGDGHLTVVTSHHRSVNCRCSVERREEREACECQSREHQNKNCQGRTLIVVTTRRQLVDGACKRVEVKTETHSVACPLQSVRTVSVCNRHGFRLLERTSWRAHDCHCEPHVRLERQRCSKKCDVAPKIVRASPCNKATCTKRLYHYYKNENCQSKHFAITARCCCPHSHQGTRKCLGPAFELRDLFYKLEHGVCIMSAVSYRQEIDCQRNERFETAASASGDTIVLKTWQAVKDCKCLKIKTKSHVKHKECQRPEVKRECIKVPEHRTVQTVTRYVKLSKHSACEKLEELTEKPVVCPLDILHRGPCHEDVARRAFVRSVTRITFKKVNCRCISHRSVHHEVCRCFQSRLATRCRERKGVLSVTRYRYEKSPDRASCHERSDTQTVQVNCDETWRAPRDGERENESDISRPHSRKRRDLSGEDNVGEGIVDRRRKEEEPREEGAHENGWDGHFSHLLEREVRVGCTCRVQRRKRSCRSHCPSESKRLVCKNGNELFRVVTTYRRSSHCSCSYRVRRIPLRIHRPPRKVVHHKCHDCEQRVETIEHRVRDCKATRIRRWHTRRCCCRKAPRKSVRCKASQLLVTQTQTERLSSDGYCVPQYRNSFKTVTCRIIISEKALTTCANGRRVWRREIERLDNCMCKRTFQRVTRSCGFKVCHSAIVKFGPCINCASKEKKIEFIYSPATNRCEAKTFHKIQNCCCSPPVKFKRCRKNRLLSVTRSYKFHRSTGTCKKSEKSKDITHNAYKRCLETKRTTIGKCMENGFQVIVTLQPTLVECACHKIQSFRFVQCRCNPPAITESCVENGTIKYRKTILEQLDGTTCKSVTDEVYAQIECPLGSTSEGICDSTTCQRVITDVTYSVSNCTCQRLTTQRLETCCCPPAVNETRSCQRADNTMVVTQQYLEFDLQNRACITRTRTDRSGTVCPQNYRSFASPCDQYRNNSLYRTVSESITVVSGCECVPQTTTRTELCGCDTPQNFTVCTADNQLLTYRIDYRPDSNNTVCLPNRVDLSSSDVVCDGTQRSDVPICSTGTRSSATGETRITVVTSWMVRSSNCTCAMQTRSEQVLCACPENSRPTIICDKWRHEKLNVTTVYSLLVTGSVRQCIPSKVVTRLGPVHCQAPVVQLGNCQFGLMTVNTLIHKLHACSCVPKSYRHHQRCHKILKTCINKLPDWLCADLDRRHGICQRNFTTASNDPELQQLAEASALCDRECNRCDGCHSIGGHWQFKYADRECLVTDTRYPGLSIRKDAGFKHCLNRCKADLACRSFDFYLPSSQCTLARVDRASLHDILLPRHHLVGALPLDSQQRGATRCNLYERICSLRVTTRLEEVQLGCPGRHVTAGDSHCSCQPVSLALGQYYYCHRAVTVSYYVRSYSGKCQKRSTLVRVPCRPCRDKLPLDKCRAIDSLGGCSVGSSARLCAKTCRLCQCDGREFVRLGVCDKRGKRVDTVVRTEWVRGFRMCQVILQKVTKQCLKCLVGLAIHPQPCIGKHRQVLHTETALVGGKCKQTVKRLRLPCHRCHVGVTTTLGPCANGRRSINSFFAVQASHGEVCREQKTSYHVGCSGCPAPIVKTQPCIDGKQLRQVRYFVRQPHSDQCHEARFEAEDRCGTLCHDQVSEPECSYQHQTGQCAWNLFTRTVCPRTCKRC